MQQVVDNNDVIVYVAPSKGFSPLILFKDDLCEDTFFPTLFFGEPKEYHRQAKTNY